MADRARKPTHPPRRWPGVICIGGTILSTVCYFAAVPLIPALVGDHPVLLEALGGTPPAMAAAGAFARTGRISLLAAIVAPLGGLGVSAAFFWWAGRRYGAALAGFLSRRSFRAGWKGDRAVRLYRRYGGWTLVLASYLPVPNPVIYAVAGWSGFGFLRFAVLSLIGTMLRVTPAVALGYTLGDQAVRVAVRVSQYSTSATTVALSLAVLGLFWWRHARRGRPVGPGWRAPDRPS
jgi:membrane protein DedA with SNARE-associated domain